MKIEERIRRIDELCLSTKSFKPQTPFEEAWKKMLLYKSNVIHEIPKNLFSNVERQPMDIKTFQQQKNVILYSGGKDSFLTERIFDYFKIPCEIEVFDNKDTVDFIKSLDMKSVDKNIPVIYWFILKAMLRNPNANIFVGCPFRDLQISFTEYISLDSRDYLFHELNEDDDIDNSVYSVINCLQEFLVFSFARKLGYDPKKSYEDIPSKKSTIDYYIMYDDLLNKLRKDSLKLQRRINYLLEPKYFNLELEIPYIYDFRKNILEFINEKIYNFERGVR